MRLGKVAALDMARYAAAAWQRHLAALTVVGVERFGMVGIYDRFAERLAENAVNCAEQNEEVRAMIAEQNEKLTETVNGLNGKFEKIRDEICEKVHNEDVKCYRNMQTLIEESDRKLDAVKEQVAQLEPMKNTVKVITVLALLNLAGTAAVILFAMGLI